MIVGTPWVRGGKAAAEVGKAAAEEANVVRSRRMLRWVPAALLSTVCVGTYSSVLLLTLLPTAGLAAPFGTDAALDVSAIGAWIALASYHIIWCLATLAAVITARTPPGHIPLWLYSREPGDQAYFHNVLQAVEKKLDGSLRFCRKCGAFKPDLAHHSKELGSCILCYQHWDLWCNNAVGFYNYKAYLLSLLYGSLAHAASLILLLPGVIRALPHADPLALSATLWTGGDSSLHTFAWLGVLASALLGGSSFAWLLFHVHLIAHGQTAHSFSRQSGLVGAKPPKPRHARQSPFDFGLRGNLSRACGRQPLLWLLPTNQGVEGNGIFFETNVSSEGFGRYTPHG